jgi:hypothetical protein
MKFTEGMRVCDKGTEREGTVHRRNEGGVVFVLFDDNLDAKPDHEGVCTRGFLHAGHRGKKLSFRVDRELEPC